MKLRKTKRFYKTKVMTLVHREKIYNHGYPHEFMNKMTTNEIKTYLNEIRKQLKEEEIPISNINRYNKVFKSFIEEREEVYQLFKKNIQCTTCRSTLFCNTVEKDNCLRK